MKDKALSITAFATVIASLVGFMAVLAFSDGIEKADWIDAEDASMACFGLTILGTVLAWCSFKQRLGKIAAILGSVVIPAVFALLMNNSTPSPGPTKGTKPSEMKPESVSSGQTTPE
jgi:apolipoprotein N-acyltransferase